MKIIGKVSSYNFASEASCKGIFIKENNLNLGAKNPTQIRHDDELFLFISKHCVVIQLVAEVRKTNFEKGKNALDAQTLIQFAFHYPHIHTQCLKITEKVAFYIASEASYVYILNGQKLIKNAKNGPFWRVFENSINRQVSLNRIKIDGKCQNSNASRIMRHFE